MTVADLITPTPGSTPLSALLRDGSRAEHASAEGSSFMSELLAGHVSAEGYGHYLSLLHRVYTALETVGAELADDPYAAAVRDPALERLAAIETDLDHWGRSAAPSAAADAYVARIEGTRSWGGLFVAHHYTRYLGDLSGGQAIGRLLAREFGLDGAGIAFYRFEAIPKPKPYKDAYRARLDALPVDEAARARILAEVKVVFGLNGALFAELTTLLPRYTR